VNHTSALNSIAAMGTDPRSPNIGYSICRIRHQQCTDLEIPRRCRSGILDLARQRGPATPRRNEARRPMPELQGSSTSHSSSARDAGSFNSQQQNTRCTADSIG
jgi:hypothetical protein